MQCHYSNVQDDSLKPGSVFGSPLADDRKDAFASTMFAVLVYFPPCTPPYGRRPGREGRGLLRVRGEPSLRVRAHLHRSNFRPRWAEIAGIVQYQRGWCSSRCIFGCRCVAAYSTGAARRGYTFVRLKNARQSYLHVARQVSTDPSVGPEASLGSTGGEVHRLPNEVHLRGRAHFRSRL